MSAERKTVKFDNTPKTVKVNGFEAPAVIPRVKPRRNKFIITKDGIKNIESTPKNTRTQRPAAAVRRRRPTINRLNKNDGKYDTVKVNGFEAPAVLPRPKARSTPTIITKERYEDVVESPSRTVGLRSLGSLPNRNPSLNRLIISDESYGERSPFLSNTNSRNIENLVLPNSSNFESENVYDDYSTNSFVYNDFYV